ncbi:MAG: SRPBCC family protein [Bacteroidetes bacterium]|nr:SRPBCC family protein [Bacteroidota bacterium]
MITVETKINADVNKVWDAFTNPTHITKWCFASDDWHAPFAENDARTAGKFKTRMEAKDGSFGFDFEGIFSNVEDKKCIEYGLEDGRQVKINFTDLGGETKVTESFDPETENPHEMQQSGWQAILDNFKKYVENN